MNPSRSFGALIMRAFLCLLCIFTLAFTTLPPPPPAITNNLNAKRPLQALYQIEAYAAQSGWTADLARSAGDIWEALDDLPRASSYWELSLHLQPADVQLNRRLAQAYLELSRWSQAVISLTELLEHTDDNWAHFQLGVLQSVLDTASADEHFRLASRDPQYQSVIANLLAVPPASDVNRAMQIGAVLSTSKQWSAAEYVFQFAASLSPDLPEALAYTGMARDQQGKDGHAQIEEALALASDNALVRYLQGIHLHIVHDDAGSLVALQLATKLDPLNPAYAAELAAAYERTGDSVQTEYWYKAAVALSNNDPRFQALLTAFYNQPSVLVVTATP